MIEITDITHHANLLIHSDRKKFASTLWDRLKSDSQAHTFFDTTVLDIDTARSIASWATAPYDQKKLGLVSFHTITIPAQNALLKIVEEPPHNVGFIFITSNKEALLPTLLSRCNELNNFLEDESKDLHRADIFLETPTDQRMKLPFIAALLKQEDSEGRKDREAVRSFIFDIASSLSAKRVKAPIILETLEIASYAGLPSSSTKSLIEYLSLFLPRTN